MLDQATLVSPKIDRTYCFFEFFFEFLIRYSVLLKVSAVQEYPTEPLDKIPALQGRIALAGKLNIGHMRLLENYINTTLAGNLCCNTGSS